MLFIPKPSKTFSVSHDHVICGCDKYHASIILCDLYNYYMWYYITLFAQVQNK